jgi:hypothetical protein
VTHPRTLVLEELECRNKYTLFFAPSSDGVSFGIGILGYNRIVAIATGPSHGKYYKTTLDASCFVITGGLRDSYTSEY